MQSADDNDETDLPTGQKHQQAAGMVSVAEGCLPIAITVAYISPKIAKKQDNESFTYKWSWEDNSLIVTMNFLGLLTSLSDLMQSLVHLIPDST
jgi:hypothetical protein